MQGQVQRLYLNARYLKLRRDISQTPFVLRDGTVMAESSVESVIRTALGKVVSSDSIKFIPAGREDMDVRMLGTGRPFTVEIKNPHPQSLTPDDLDWLLRETSDKMSGVLVRDWQVAKRNSVLFMKSGEEEMQKSYVSLVWISRDVTSSDLEKLNGLRDVEVTQWTPLRVAHRRANAARNKLIHWMKASAVDHHRRYLTLELRTSAGCYIKEFIHGDFGRTYPCLADLLDIDAAQCCALDVTHVDLDLKDKQLDPISKKKQKCETEEDDENAES